MNKTYVRQISGSVVFRYTVAIKETGLADSDWLVKGKITVTNPNNWIGIPLSTLAD